MKKNVLLEKRFVLEQKRFSNSPDTLPPRVPPTAAVDAWLAAAPESSSPIGASPLVRGGRTLCRSATSWGRGERGRPGRKQSDQITNKFY